MSPILQTDTRLPLHVQREGCYFRSLVMLAEMHHRQLLDAADIVKLYDYVISTGAMKQDCWVLEPEKIIQSAQFFLGHGPSGRMLFRTAAKGSGLEDGNFTRPGRPSHWIRHYKTVNGHGHFVVADKTGATVWDPYFPFTTAAKELTFRGYSL